MVDSIDQLIFSLDEKEFKELQPEVLITFGGMIVSKKIKQFLRSLSTQTPLEHIDATKSLKYLFLLDRIYSDVSQCFFYCLQSGLVQKGNGNYQQQWLRFRDHKRRKHQEYLADSDHSDFKVFHQVLQSVPREFTIAN